MNKTIDLCRQAAAEGMVLLKNDAKNLPFDGENKIAVFGRCQIDFYKSGTGSGGAVHVPYSTNVIDGLKTCPEILLDQKLLSIYETWIKDHPFDDGGGGWAAEPWFQEEMPLTDQIVSDSRNRTDKAVIIIGRTAGEDQDNKAVPGSYYLTEEENKMIEHVTNHFEDVVVVLNVSNIIDMLWMSEMYRHPIKTVLYAWHGGMEGGNALADILTGRVTPSGKLTNTIAKSISDYPSDSNFGDEKENIYVEDIYVGYRYFETFKSDRVLYPFGFGLSYTTFEMEVKNFNVSEDDLTIDVLVTNTGNRAGKEVVQLYYSAPQGQLGQPKMVLGSFKKTQEVQPGESITETIRMSLENMKSYDDSGVTGNKSCYVLEAGAYDFYIGNDVRRSVQVGSHIIDETQVIETLEEAMAPVKSFKRMKPKFENDTCVMRFETVPTRTVDMNHRIQSRLPEYIEKTDTKYTLEDVENGHVTMKAFISQLSVEALATLVKGEGMCSPKVTAGTASAFGGLSKELQTYAIPVLACADGPSGIRLDSGKQASQVPIGTSIACTWNTPLTEELYSCIGEELLENRIETLLGPGMNIHRHPLNGRNFEYFSEDPHITGQFAMAFVKGLRNGGSVATLKHFVANNQEKARHLADSVVSERAVREIYLKGFEMAVRQTGAKSIMTSYNPINGIYAASNYDLNTTILRKEWGFDGIVMTDWWAKTNHPITGGKGQTYHKSYMVQGQNDLYMVVDNDKSFDFEKDDLLEAVEKGGLTVGELQRCAMNICTFILNSQTYKLKLKHTNKRHYESTSVGQYDIQPVDSKIQSCPCSLHIKERGTYMICAEVRYQSTSLAQSSFNILINGEIAVITQMHGSDDDYKTIEVAEVELDAGYYDIELEFIRKGIEVKNIGFMMK